MSKAEPLRAPFFCARRPRYRRSRLAFGAGFAADAAMSAADIGWRKSIATGAAAVALLGAVLAARHLVLTVLGGWMARQHLVYSLSTPVPEWAEWPADGMRADAMRADAMLLFLLVPAWALCVWLAALVPDKVGRTLWLMASVALAVAFGGAGEVWAGPVVLMATLVTRLVSGVTWKPVTLSLVLSLLTAGAVAVAWRTSGAEAAPDGDLLSRVAYGVGVCLSVLLTACCLRRRRCKLMGGGLASACVAAVLYLGFGHASPAEAWMARKNALARWIEPAGARELREALAAYRLSEAEASVCRMGSAEASTDWARFSTVLRRAEALPGGAGTLESLWLRTDALLYGAREEHGCVVAARWMDFKAVVPVDFYRWPRRLMVEVPLEAANHRAVASTGVLVSRQATLAALARLEAGGGPDACWAAEAIGALKLDAGVYPQAAAAFRRALAGNARNAPIWWALAKAEAFQTTGDARASEALAQAWVHDPRLLFSPELEREPLRRVAASALGRLDRLIVDGSAGGHASSWLYRAHRFREWRRQWDVSSGRMAIFLHNLRRDPAPSATIACLRLRLDETLRGRDEAKVGAYFASAFALVCDRHITLGGAHTLFAMCEQGGHVWSSPTGPHRLVSRPVSVNWRGMRTDGGMGASFVSIEEQVMARLLCYGNERP